VTSSVEQSRKICNSRSNNSCTPCRPTVASF